MRVIVSAAAVVLMAAGVGWGLDPQADISWDFEQQCEWVVNPLDPGTVSVAPSTDRASSGKRSLLIAGALPGSIGAAYTPWGDWSGYDKLVLDFYVPKAAPEGLAIYVYIKDKQYWWFQTAPFSKVVDGKRQFEVPRDRWVTATIDISPHSTVWEPSGHERSWDHVLYYPREFGIRIFSDQAWSGGIYVDNIRLVPPPGGPLQPRALNAKIAPRAESATVPVYEKFELTFSLDADYPNPFDPDVVDVQGHFVAPSGRQVDVPGFYYQDYRRERDENGYEFLIPVGAPSWKVRFAATEVGAHRYWVTVHDALGDIKSAEQQFTATDPADPHGYIRVSAQDPRYFEYSNGDFYYPIGLNMRDGGDQARAQRGTFDFDDYFPDFQTTGLNFVRTWMCAWWASIEWDEKYESRYDGVGRYCMYNAWRLDHLVKLAEKHGIYLEVTLNSHGQDRRDLYDQEWEYNPYAASNGGWVADPGLFFTDQRVKDSFRKRYRYIIARWGYSPHIMSWDLWNEVDLVQSYSPAEVAAWHQEMAQALKAMDPWKHLICTHVCGYFWHDRGQELFTLPEIEYTQADAYWGNNVADSINQGYLGRDYGKPYMVIEYGPQTIQVVGGMSRQDVTRIFRVGLWSTLMLPHAGAGQWWFWDLWRQYNLAPYHQAAVNFIQGDDRRGKQWSWIVQATENRINIATRPGNLIVEAMQGPEGIRFYVCDWDRMAQDPAPDAKLIPNAQVSFLRMTGQYSVEYYLPATGQLLVTATVAGADKPPQRVVVPLPPFQQDLAVVMRPVAPAAAPPGA